MASRKTRKQDENDQTFEESLAGLEEIVEAMENEELPLEDLVSYYEKGSAMLERCECLLKGARERIELITLRDQETSNDTSEEPVESDDSKDDDIRLF